MAIKKYITSINLYYKLCILSFSLKKYIFKNKRALVGTRTREISTNTDSTLID